MKPFNRVNEADLAFFESILPGRVFSGEAISTDYDHDEMTIYGHYAPEAVLQAQSTEEISAVLRYCNGRNIAVTPRGAGTGLCGGCVATEGGVVLSTERMKRVLEVDTRNMTATVEPGVLLMEFPKALEGTGLFYPPDPGEKTATMGGNAMTNAGGIFFTPIAEELGQPTAAVNLTLTICNLTFAIAGLSAPTEFETAMLSIQVVLLEPMLLSSPRHSPERASALLW